MIIYGEIENVRFSTINKACHKWLKQGGIDTIEIAKKKFKAISDKLTFKINLTISKILC